MPLPAFGDEKVPAFVKVTFARSAVMTPDKVPPVTVASVVPSYTLFATTVPVTVIGFGVIFILTALGCVSV